MLVTIGDVRKEVRVMRTAATRLEHADGLSAIRNASWRLGESPCDGEGSAGFPARAHLLGNMLSELASITYVFKRRCPAGNPLPTGPHDPRSGSQGEAQLLASPSALVGKVCREACLGGFA